MGRAYEKEGETLKEVTLKSIARKFMNKYEKQLLTEELIRRIERDIEIYVLSETGNFIKVKLGHSQIDPGGVQLEDISFIER